MLTAQKGAREEVRVGLTEYRGRRVLMARCFYQEADGGAFLPGRNGLNLDPELATWAALAVLRTLGLTDPAQIAEALQESGLSEDVAAAADAGAAREAA